jgi:hypothetical protein
MDALKGRRSYSAPMTLKSWLTKKWSADATTTYEKGTGSASAGVVTTAP